MQAYTEQERAELVQFNRAIIAQHEAYAVPESGWPEHVRLLVSSARIALAALETKPEIEVEDGDVLSAIFPVGTLFYTDPPVAALRLPDAIPPEIMALMVSKSDENFEHADAREIWDAIIAEVERLNATAPASEKRQ